MEPVDVDQLIKVNLSQRLRELRAAKGMSQHALGLQTGILPNQISGYETGKWIPQLSTLYRLTAALDTTVSDLLKGVC